MASGSGSWSSTNAGGNRGRLTWETTQSPGSVGAGTSSVSVRLRVWFESRYSIVDSSNTYTVTGAWSGSGSRSVNHGGSGGRTLLYDGTITVPTSYANTVSRSFSASFSGINVLPSIPSVSGSHTVGRRPVSAPNAATGVSASRVSDSRQNVSWSASSTSARPVASQTVQRRRYTGTTNGWSSWTNVSGTLSGGARSWADTSTVANNVYQYRVVTRNSAGSATSSGSGSIRTTPAAPSIGSAVKQPDGSIRVSFTPNTPYADYLTHLLQDNPGGTGWVTVATQAGSGALVHGDPDPSVTHQYRVATRSTYSNPGTLTSAYSSASNIVQLLAPPNAPTRLTPAGTIDRDEPLTFEWRHNPADTTVQSAAQVQYRAAGSGTWIDAALNLVANPSWETGLDGWRTGSANTTSYSRTTSFQQMWADLGGRDGDYIAEFRSVGNSSSFYLVTETSEYMPVTPGQWIAFSGLIATDSGIEAQWRAQFMDSSGNAFNTVGSDQGWVDARFYEGARLTGAAQVPSGATHVRLLPWGRPAGGVGVSPAGSRVWADSVALTSASTETSARQLVEAMQGSGDSTVRIPALGVSGQFEWRVRTKGAHPDWSPWSSIGSFTLAATPTVAINSPDGSDLHESRVTLLIGYDQADGSPQSRVQAELVYNGAVLETLSWSGTADTGTFKTALDDDETYTVNVRVQAGNGLWSDYDSVTFLTDFPSPVPFQVEAEWDRETGAVTVAAAPVSDDPEYVEAETLTYQRRDSADSPWVTIAENVDPGTTITDPTPALGAPEYRATSHTSLPSSNTGPTSVVPWVHGPHDHVYVNTGPGYELVGTARGNQASDDYAIEQSSFTAAGIDLPVAIFGTSETGSLSFTGRIFDPRIGVEPVTTRDEWRALLRHRQVVCYRDCQGRKMFGLLHVSFSQQGPVETVNITVDEVWHEEGVVA